MDEVNKLFEEHVERIVGPIAAGSQRKRVMREELLAHLWASFDEHASADAAKRDLGDAEKLRHELQQSVPRLERFISISFLSKEFTMWRAIAITLICIMVMAGVAILFHKAGGLINCGMMAIAGGWWMAQLARGNFPAWLKTSLACLIGLAAALTGAAIIMPALAKMNQGVFVTPIIIAMAIGIVITLEGLGLVIIGIFRPRVAAQ